MTTYLTEADNSGTVTNSSASVPVPSGAAGHPARMVVSIASTTATITPGSGWTVVSGPHTGDSSQQVVIFEKDLTVVDSTAAVNFSSAVRWALGLVVAVDGAFGDPVVNTDASGGTNLPIPASNTASETADVVALGGVTYAAASATGVTPPAGWTELKDSATSHATGNKRGVWIVKRDTQVSAGSASTAASGTIGDGTSVMATFLVNSTVMVAAATTGWQFGRGRRGTPVLVPPPPPPPPPPPVSILAFGTTLFGQSYARYKVQTINSQSGRYDAVENDTFYNLGGTTRRGGAVTRVYNDSETGPGTWTDAHPNYIRADQPVIYSSRWSDATPDATIKATVRTFLRSKDPATTAFMWWCNRHEFDNDSTRQPGSAGWTRWFQQNRLVREVMDETEFAGRTDFRFGFITTGVPWNPGTGPNSPKGWRTIMNTMAAERGGPDTWGFVGGDRYNPNWNGADFFGKLTDPTGNWFSNKDACFEETGLPFVVGEGSTARPYSNYTTGYSKAQLETMRADWLRQLLTLVRDRNYFDAFAWWRVPATTGGYTNAFSTIMGTPTGYDAEIAAAGIAGPPLGFDAPKMVEVHSEFMIKSIDLASANHVLGAAPHTISYA